MREELVVSEGRWKNPELESGFRMGPNGSRQGPDNFSNTNTWKFYKNKLFFIS